MSYLVVTSTAPPHVGLPPEFIKSISPFGSLINADSTFPTINSWSDDSYFIGGVNLNYITFRNLN